MSKLSEHDNTILNCIFNPHLPPEDNISYPPEKLEDKEDSTSEVEESKKLEIQAIQLAENGKLTEALNLINKAIQITPYRPSLFNNRANIYQYLRKFEDALNDATKAINLSTDKYKRTLCLAYCQRGILHRKAENMEMAREDFENAAKMGNDFAKKQLIELNPYAALCNQMLRQVMGTWN
ncbi:tetratricopeptide repeat protein 36 homolog [Leptinotarsa decemlineata]|uniref:tetratricopeptide repeat protein 36 homolog n=1 Tax=Leptinotarsa decemlineata TaxID=7539 RepID=UPI003D308C67